MVMLADARTPPGLRLYAIGDVHGRADLLADMHRRIARDLARRPVADWRVIHLGDYIDRGPDSAGALELLLDYQGEGHGDFLIGNHDRFLLDFLLDPPGAEAGSQESATRGSSLRQLRKRPGMDQGASRVLTPATALRGFFVSGRPKW